MLAPNTILFVVRDDVEKEYFKEDNSMEQIMFASAIFGLLLLVCGMNDTTAVRVARDFSIDKVPLTPKLPTLRF
ncbi:MAG: hypothetical protein AOA66_1220 [Candidatus Bathyarchaeota archaeon BA2]|nr:MAG: hypothetical protein AOA66_1220 [Candidatus Bathyarchaeota archaeon BA2]